jgi:hydroxymethylpyrimidine pyrophosphatase-like HAD family hydrolase
MSYLRLLSTDFDGTLIAHPSDGRCSPAFADVLKRHSESGGLWAINTGRGLEHAIQGLAIFSAPVEPDYLLTNEREIFFRAGEGGWEPDRPWNDLCRDRHEELFSRAGAVLSKIVELASRSLDITLIRENGDLIGLVTSSEDVMEEVAGFIGRESDHLPEFSFQRNTVYMRFCHRDYHKGAALGELIRKHSLHRGEVFAAGDHFNDLSMLDGKYAAFPCCPSNAIEQVKSVVSASGGYVAALPASDGVAEAWRYFLNKP